MQRKKNRLHNWSCNNKRIPKFLKAVNSTLQALSRFSANMNPTIAYEFICLRDLLIEN